MEDDRKEMGRYIRGLREGKRWTMDQLARAIQLVDSRRTFSGAAIQGIEAGKTKLPLARILPLSRVFGVSPLEFVRRLPKDERDLILAITGEQKMGSADADPSDESTLIPRGLQALKEVGVGELGGARLPMPGRLASYLLSLDAAHLGKTAEGRRWFLRRWHKFWWDMSREFVQAWVGPIEIPDPFLLKVGALIMALVRPSAWSPPLPAVPVRSDPLLPEPERTSQMVVELLRQMQAREQELSEGKGRESVPEFADEAGGDLEPSDSCAARPEATDR